MGLGMRPPIYAVHIHYSAPEIEQKLLAHELKTDMRVSTYMYTSKLNVRKLLKCHIVLYHASCSNFKDVDFLYLMHGLMIVGLSLISACITDLPLYCKAMLICA